MSRFDLSVGADATRAGREVQFRPNTFGVAGTTDSYLLYGRVSRPDRLAGWSSHTLDAQGGQPTSRLADDLKQASNQTLSYYFSEIRRLQGADKHVVITLNGGQNDTGDTTASRGPVAAPGNSAAGRKDNLGAIVSRVEEIWALNGWDASELNWMIVGSHPMTGPVEDSNAIFRAADREFVDTLDQAVAVDLAQLTSYSEMFANGWYQNGGADTAHLTRAGYEQLSLRVVEAVSIPEPASAAVVGFAAAGLLLRRRRRAA